MNGWTGKMLRVNLTTRTATIESSEKYQKYIGGKGMATRIIYDEVPMKTEPTAPESKFVFAVGPNTGSTATPRTAIGIYEPGHYVFVVAEGRQKPKNCGISVYRLAQFMQELGVQTAYNLDGGGSSALWFNGQLINHPTTDGKTFAERGVSDIVYIGYR